MLKHLFRYGIKLASGSVEADTVVESTPGAGVTIEGVLIKDGVVAGVEADPDFGAEGIQADVIAESTAAAGVTVDGVLLKDGVVTGALVGNADTATLAYGAASATYATQLTSDEFVIAILTVADATGGSTDAALTLQLSRRTGETTEPITSVRQVYINASLAAAQYAPFTAGAGLTGLDFETATIGTIAATGDGWALVTTDPNGAFACTAKNTADETLYFSASTANRGNTGPGISCVVLGSNSDAAAWSA